MTAVNPRMAAAVDRVARAAVAQDVTAAADAADTAARTACGAAGLDLDRLDLVDHSDMVVAMTAPIAAAYDRLLEECTA